MTTYCRSSVLNVITLLSIYSLGLAANETSNVDKFSVEYNSLDIKTYRSSLRAMKYECTCKNYACGCCVNIDRKLVKTKVCVTFGSVSGEPAVLDVTLSTTRFPKLLKMRIRNSILDSYCVSPPLVPLKICLSFDSYKWTETSVKFCPKLDIRVLFISVPIKKFRCFALHGDKGMN